MKKNEIYTEEERELFKALEDDLDNGTYEPIPKKELEKAKDYYQRIAINTIEKMTRKKFLKVIKIL